MKHGTDSTNTIFQLALELVNSTAQHIFLTGKAGTGKTTFLRHVKEHTTKNTVVVAPTGVAAINAGGVTMHSFFQLPFGAFVPGTVRRDNFIGYVDITDKHSLFKNIHFSGNKREMLEELELLIIDEVSMMRCDMLDAIDTILRHFRKSPNIPFGGVQVVYIGDMFQLPPVISQDEWKVLQEHYDSPFFFSSKVVQEAPPVYVELKKIYRQSEQQFISVLNNVRDNRMTSADYQLLHSRFDPAFTSPEEEHYITVTTHNKKAEAINAAELAKLPGKLYSFKGDIKDDFSDKALPTDMVLQLKVGAQVMFIKNDSGTERRYFNGKLATVSKIQNDEITVSFVDDGEELVLEKETWKNIRYIYNKENDDIDEEELGSFTQYPIRLAWAITVHKSQGLTFERAVIDAGASFAAGQVYVALSRCTSIDGMVLRSKLHPAAISTDRRIIEFAQREVNTDSLEAILEKEKYAFWSQALLKLFDWSKLVSTLYYWTQLIPQKKLPDVEGSLRMAQAILSVAKEGAATAQKYRQQLGRVLDHTHQTKDTTLLKERMEKAVDYFAKLLGEEILTPIQAHLKELAYNNKVKKYKEEVVIIESFVWQQLQKLLTASYGELTFFNDFARFQKYNPEEAPAKKQAKQKVEKGASLITTLELFKEGKSIAEIATVRNLAVSTVEGHLAQFVREGKLEITQLVAEERVAEVLKAIGAAGTESLGALKYRLGEEYSYSEIRAVLNHYYYQQKLTA
jgi:hypothetical protein